MRLSRPDAIVCIADTHADKKGLTWCGERVGDFAFVDADHAAMNGRYKGRLAPCPQCRDAVIAGLMEGALPLAAGPLPIA